MIILKKKTAKNKVYKEVIHKNSKGGLLAKNRNEFAN